MFTRFLCGVAFAALSMSAASADDLSTVLITTDKSKITLVFDRALPNVPGKSMKGLLVEYQPGGSNPAHTHPYSAFIYATVLEGAIRSKVNDGPEKVYRAGESWAEVPGDHHAVSANDHIPPDLVVACVIAYRKPPEVKIWTLRNQSRVGNRPPSTSTPHWPACCARRC